MDEKELEKFIEQKIKGCNFDLYYEQGFEINQEEPNAEVRIRDSKVEVDLSMNLNVVKGEDSSLVKHHKVSVDSEH